MRVFVTGGSGYIGRILVPYLLENGHLVTVIDRDFLNSSGIEKTYTEMGVRYIKDDIRYFDPNLLRDHDAVVDLAALSNDPSGDLDPIRTWDINYLGRVRVARLAKKLGVKKYIVASSCSVYGFRDDLADETSQVNPLTTYAQANVAVENDNLKLADSSFQSNALRFATAFGYSKRMRLDIAINAMTFYAAKTGKIRLMRDGTQYRPFVHILDISKGIMKTLENSDSAINGEIFNIGSDRLNTQLKDLAQIVSKSIGLTSEIEWYGDPDARSYRASFKKSRDLLGFEAQIGVEDGVKEILEKINSGELTDKPEFHTVDFYRKIIEATNISREFEYNMHSKIL